MDYGKAKDIRKQGLSSLITENLVGGKGIGSSFTSAISDRTKATFTGIKESFDPLNIAKKMTGGSKLAPALLGRMMGRKQEDIEHFSGKPKKSKGLFGGLFGGKSNDSREMAESLGSIYKELQRASEEKKLDKQEQKNKVEGQEAEEQRRNSEIIKAIIGTRIKSTKSNKDKIKEIKQTEKEKPFRDEKGRFAKKPTEKEFGKEPTTPSGPTGPTVPTTKAPAPSAPTAPPSRAPSAPAPSAPTAPPSKPPTTPAPSAPTAPPSKPPSAPAPSAPTAPPSKPSVPTATPQAPTSIIPKPAVSTGTKIAAGTATALKGRAAQVAVALGTLGITSKAAIGAIVATSAKESGLDPFKPEDGVKPWKATLEKRGVDYLYLKFPQLAKGGRVAKQLNMPDGVPADYIKQIMDKGDEAWFTLVYPGGADAYKYRGRGLIQITGKGVYKSVGDIIGIDLEKDPDAITRDFDTAAKATGAYLMNSLGRGDSKKGLAALNALSDEKESLKVVIANVARGFAGSDKDKIDKMFDPSSNLGKTTASQLEAASKYSQLGSDAASGKQIDQASKENKDLKQTTNDKPAPSVVNNLNVDSKNSSSSREKPKEEDDRPAFLKKAKG